MYRNVAKQQANTMQFFARTFINGHTPREKSPGLGASQNNICQRKK